MLANRPKTKILVDGGDPEETRKIKALLGFVDGQTTNPTLIPKNPAIRQRGTAQICDNKPAPWRSRPPIFSTQRLLRQRGEASIVLTCRRSPLPK